MLETRSKSIIIKKLVPLLFLLLPAVLSAQKEKAYNITMYQVWDLWQDTTWVQTESVDDADFKCHVIYDSLGFCGKFVINDEIYSVYAELERKDVNLDDYLTTYYGKR